MQSETTPYRPSPPPLDAEGFVKSFSLGDLDGAAASFDELGFVVIDGVLSEAERVDTINDIWAVIEGFCVGSSASIATTRGRGANAGLVGGLACSARR